MLSIKNDKKSNYQHLYAVIQQQKITLLYMDITLLNIGDIVLNVVIKRA